MNSQRATNLGRTQKRHKTSESKPVKQTVALFTACNKSKAVAKVRRRKNRAHNQKPLSWAKVAERWYPNVNRSTLRRFVVDKSYLPKDPGILQSLGLAPFPPIVSDVLAVLHGPLKLPRTWKKRNR